MNKITNFKIRQYLTLYQHHSEPFHSPWSQHCSTTCLGRSKCSVGRFGRRSWACSFFSLPVCCALLCCSCYPGGPHSPTTTKGRSAGGQSCQALLKYKQSFLLDRISIRFPNSSLGSKATQLPASHRCVSLSIDSEFRQVKKTWLVLIPLTLKHRMLGIPAHPSNHHNTE
jgi:hypothetical protein